MFVLLKVWGWLKSAALWLWKHPVLILSAIASGVGAYLLLRSSRNRIGELEDALEVQAIRTKVAKKEAEAEVLKKQADSLDPIVEKLEADVKESKKKVLEIENGEPLGEMTDDEIADKFTSLGF